MKTKIVFDMETGDPDDVLTLIMLLDHPRVELKAVTITPGSLAQTRLVLAVMNIFNVGPRQIPVGCYDINWPKDCVSGWHDGKFAEHGTDVIRGLSDGLVKSSVEPGWQVLLENCGEDVTLLTGAPLKNLSVAIDRASVPGAAPFKFGRWVAQGGFVGDNILPMELQLEKFRGMTTCPTYNFNGDVKGALKALNTDWWVGQRLLVSKNVCHGVSMAPGLRKLMESAAELNGRKSLAMVAQHCPDGKALHDPLAMACALTPAIGTWVRVNVYRHKGEWGSTESSESKTQIITKYDRDEFIVTLLEGQE